jgi:hypothetical protein
MDSFTFYYTLLSSGLFYYDIRDMNAAGNADRFNISSMSMFRNERHIETKGDNTSTREWQIICNATVAEVGCFIVY